MLLFIKNNIDDVVEKDIIEYNYAPVEEKDEWKIQMVKELIDVKNDEIQIENITKEEADLIKEFLCTD